MMNEEQENELMAFLALHTARVQQLGADPLEILDEVLEADPRRHADLVEEFAFRKLI